MTTAANHYDQMLARHYSWMLGGDIPALAAEQARLLESLGITPAAAGTTAIDLGCGPGNQALALAALGFTRVLAVDASSVLLDEPAAHAGDDPTIQLVHADLRTVLPQIAEPVSAAVIVCMGDTLTHLPDKTAVTVLLGDVTQALAQGGALVITYRRPARRRRRRAQRPACAGRSLVVLGSAGGTSGLAAAPVPFILGERYGGQRRAAAVAAPGVAALPERDGGDDQRGGGVGPPPAEQAVETQPDQQHRGQVCAQQGLFGVGDRAGRAEFTPGAALRGREDRHDQQRQPGQDQPDRRVFGLLAAQ